MRAIVWLPVVLVSLGLVACDEKKNEGATKPAASAVAAASGAASATTPSTAPKDIKRLDHPGTEEGAKALLEAFLKPDADHKAMTESLRPSAEDYGAIFVDDAAAKARLAYDEQWDKGTYVIKGKEEQTNLLMWKATTQELREGTGDSSKFPGGYKKIADKLKPGLTFYRFKFVKPEDKHGMAYDGLVHVNGHWVMVSKPYRAL